MGGFWILEAANMDEALAWAKKAAIAWDVPGEVRELLFYPVVTRSRSRRNAILPVRSIRYEENNNEIHLFGLLRQRQS
jgi:hypothetical protein